MSNNPPAVTVCQSCEAKVDVVFVVDDTGVLFTPVVHNEQAVIAVVGTTYFPYPDVTVRVTGEHKWLCEKCVRRIEHVDGSDDRAGST